MHKSKSSRARRRTPAVAEATSTLILALEAAYQDIRSNHPDAAPAVFVTYYTTATYGHIWFEAWTRTRSKKTIDEIHINSARFSEGPEAVLCTMLHEAAHSINRTRKVEDVSRNMRYHNRKFAATAQEVGLKTEKDPIIGIITPGLESETAERYALTLTRLKAAISIYQPYLSGTTNRTTGGDTDDDNTSKDPGDDEPKNNRQVKAVCHCEKPRIIRGARSTLEAAPIVCLACGEEFEIDV